ncbi:Mitogen-activated protein kinase kinase kinase [Quillaja saponaria]|uniref:Mitogen-activated protein kinase kinase kinase n=1 Tax=Quillaja saponaria TaxID=32244 RepID=A0AAD7PCC9_QUISA|nr:Mitogen-activated protein kinase kinase kinase [Quillaja saponaria]
MAFLLINHPNFCFLVCLLFLSSIPFVYSLSSISISESSNQTLICALQPAANKEAFLNCTSFPEGIPINPLIPNVTYSEIVAGNGFVCALRTPSFSSISVLVCWRFSNINGTNMVFYKRIYRGSVLKQLDAGNSHVCGLVNGTSRLECWQWPRFDDSSIVQKFSSLAVGEDFFCGLSEIGNITCFGRNNKVVGHHQPINGKFSVVAAGFRHACAISSFDNSLHCWGEMDGEKPNEKFNSLALGESRSCAVKLNGIVVCWGANNFSMPQSLQGTRFVSIEAKRSIFCGVASFNYSLYCWGNESFESNFKVFDKVLPGPCRIECPCGPLPGSAEFCQQGNICNPCESQSASPQAEPPFIVPSPQAINNNGWSNKMVAFLMVGCVGSSALLLVFSFLLFRYCKGRGCRRVHDSGRLDEAAGNSPSQQEAPQSVPPILEKRLSHMISMGNGGHLQEFSLQVLLEATNNFSEDHKIGTGSFGSVYHATLDDNREVAIKRAETSASSASYAILGGTKRQEDKDNAFVNELESLSRLNHKNLVRLLGFFEDNNERILVYEYMKNGTLHDHLHKLHTYSPLVSWAARIKVALDAARGIEYLHVYTIPPIIHRDIKSSNILLDDTWIAKVSDFGLSLMGPQDEESHISLHAAGTVGYMDPEYYRLQQLTTKSDVYSFGVVLLEVLSGYKAIHKNENGVPRNVVDFVVPYIVQDEIHRILDPKVPPPTPFEIEAVAYVGYLAADCVSLEGIDRPSMTEIVNSLERALAACLAQPTLSRSPSAGSLS